MKQPIIAELKAAGRREVPRDVHDVLCRARVATLQEDGPYAGLLYCAACGFGYQPEASGPLERPWLAGQLKRVDDLARLEEGWSGERSLAPTDAAAVTARALLHAISALHTVDPTLRPQMVPTVEGGIGIVWMEQGYDLEIEVEPDGAISGYLRRNADGAEMSWSACPDAGQADSSTST